MFHIWDIVSFLVRPSQGKTFSLGVIIMNGKKEQRKHSITFFIDTEKFTTTEDDLTVRTLLVDFAKEDPTETTLVLQKGNKLTKYTNLDKEIELKNSMKFVVYHNEPTTVS